MHRDSRPRRGVVPILLISCVAFAAVLGPLRPGAPANNRLRPGQVVSVRGLSMVVPAPGTSVWADALSVGGVETDIGVETRPDGTVIVHTHGPEATTELAATVITNPCQDGAYTLAGDKWASTMYWYFKSSTTPTGMDATAVESEFQKAVANITGAHNNCSLADNVSANAVYKGRTTSAIDISSLGGCLARDSRSVVGFGGLPSGYLGLTCWWMDSNKNALEADMMLNKVSYHWYVTKPSSCSAKWNIQAGATHEFGHVFGLAHVSETYHPTLTMSPVIMACQQAEVTLGLGDVRALEALY